MVDISTPRSSQGSMSVRSRAQEVAERAHRNELASKILDGIEKLLEKYESSSKRWIWELI